jgi:ABC-2 type transport system ATP-binding protein
MDKGERETEIPRLLELVGLGRRTKTKLSAFSKGMLQRLGLAQALLNEPKLVFLDEPTSGLDPHGRMLVRDIIKDLRSEGITVFLNSHFLSEIELTCDRVAFIRSGSIVRVAPLSALEEEKLNLTIRIGNPGKAVLEGLSLFGKIQSVDDVSGRILIRLEDEEKIPQLVNWLVRQGQAIYELSPKKMSLEDQFLEIVGEEMLDA